MTALVQYKTSVFSGSALALAYDTDPVAAHLLVAIAINRGGGGLPSTPAGWAVVGRGGENASDNDTMYWRVAPGGPVSVSITGMSNEARLVLLEFDNAGAVTLGDSTTVMAGPIVLVGGWVPLYDMGSVSVSGEGLVVGFISTGDPGGGRHITFTEEPGFTTVYQGLSVASSLTPESMVSYRSVSSGVVAWSPDGSWGVHYGGVLAAFEIAPVFTADFAASPSSGTAPLSVAFTDESFGGTGTPITWAWTFGAAGTSSLQDPTFVFTSEGSYSVSLTVTTDDGETGTATRIVSVGTVYVPPAPGGALIEIRAAAVGSSRWGTAKWGTGSATSGRWSPAGWVNVTPQSVDATVLWGSHEPSAGVLAQVEAGTWEITTYDPERLLDPGNESSPYHADLRAGLPIRIRHRGTIIRQGVCETIAYYHSGDVGGIRVTDAVSILARTPVPESSIVADTLRARARDVIAAAGLRVTVEPDPPTGDPALAPRLEGEESAWRHIADAAEQVLQVPFVDRVGTLHFRPWADPYDRGRFVDETQLIELGTIVQTSGLYSVVQAQQTVGDGGALIERRLTPTPRYGAVTYTRSDPTPDAGAWADAVLADRAVQTVQWIPGEVYPLTADDVEYFATLEAMERLGVENLAADPPVSVSGIIIGGTFRLLAKKDSEALWRFEFELAQSGALPLYVDGSDPPEFLYHEDGVTFLYPG